MNNQIYEEATDWIVMNRQRELDDSAKKHFDAWLRQSPQHLVAYLEMSSVWEDVASIDPHLNAGADELIARARADGNVVHLESQSGVRNPNVFAGKSARSKRRAPGKVGLHFGLAASVLLAIAGTWFLGQRNLYSTGVGEQRSIVLSDGSTVELNSRTRLRVRFSDAERDIDLLSGQALFEVAKNPQRPFVVTTGGAHVRAVGTQFDVYRKSSGTVVTVVEGKVAVYDETRPVSGVPLEYKGDPNLSSSIHNFTANSQVAEERRSSQSQGGESMAAGKTGSGAMFIGAGEQAVVTFGPAGTISSKPANIGAATAWTHRSLVFDSSPLTEVAEEFNRYNSRPIVIVGTQLAEFHVSGVFSSVEPSLFLRFLRAQPELVVAETDKEVRVSKK
jgi:transmembrane sensor